MLPEHLDALLSEERWPCHEFRAEAPLEFRQ
jgi:hypothetical protein